MTGVTKGEMAATVEKNDPTVDPFSAPATPSTPSTAGPTPTPTFALIKNLPALTFMLLAVAIRLFFD